MQELKDLISITESNVSFYKNLGKAIQKRYGLNLVQMTLAKGSYGHIYFIKDKMNGNVKIGTTRNLEKRIKQISNKNDELEILKVLNVPLDYSINMKVEKFLHNHFKEYRKRGEWFSECVVELFEKDFTESTFEVIIKDITYEVILKILNKQLNLSFLKKIMNFINDSIENNTRELDEFEEIDIKEDELFYELLKVVNNLDIEKINKELAFISEAIYNATKDIKYYPLFKGAFYV